MCTPNFLFPVHALSSVFRGKFVQALNDAVNVGVLARDLADTALQRSRHFGLLALAAKTERLALARRLLAMPPANPQVREDAQAFMRRVAAIGIECCPHCKVGHWRVLEQLSANRALQPLPRPHAEARRDLHTHLRTHCRVWSYTHAGICSRRSPHHGPSSATRPPQTRRAAAFDADPKPRTQLAARNSRRGAARHIIVT